MLGAPGPTPLRLLHFSECFNICLQWRCYLAKNSVMPVDIVGNLCSIIIENCFWSFILRIWSPTLIDEDTLHAYHEKFKPNQTCIFISFFPPVCCETQLESHLKMKTAKVGPLLLVVRRDESGDPLPRGETSARLMRRTAVRQSSSSLRLWCLSRISSMIQNILKYRTVIIGLQNARLRVRGNYHLNFSVVGGLICLRGKTV